MSIILRKLIKFLLGLSKNTKSLIVIIFDAIVIFVAWFIFVILPAIFLTGFEYGLTDYVFQIYSLSYTLPIISYLISMILLNGYREILRSFSLNNIYPIFFSSSVFFCIMILVNLFILEVGSLTTIFIQSFSVAATTFLFIVISRVIFRTLATYASKQVNSDVYLYGSGTAAQELFSSLSISSDVKVKAFVTDDNESIGRELFSTKIISLKDAVKEMKKNNKCSFYIASRSISNKRKKEIIDICASLGIIVKKISPFSDMIKEKEVSLTDLSVSDLLPRSNLDDFSEELNELKNKSVLVTGAGGSIGSEICRVLARSEAKTLVIIDISEPSLFAISEELNEINKKISIKPILASVKNRKTLNNIFSKYKPDYVYHAAAYKHVPILEDTDNYSQSIKNNFFGTCNIAEVSSENNVSKFIFVSTDKAVRPTNLMGASKRMAEIYLESMSDKSKTLFSSVRFGNVIDSSGSVVPTFRKQIKNGGPVTVTHPDIIRYFMTISEAAYLVILASLITKEPAVYMLQMGDPMKIDDLAKRLIKLSGNKIKTNETEDGIEIIYTGLRPGEKLYEELLVNENDVKTDHPKIFMDTSKTEISLSDMKLIREKVSKLIDDDDIAGLKDLLKIYTDYRENNNS